MTLTPTNNAGETIINIGGANVSDVNKPLIIDGVEYWQILPGVSCHVKFNVFTACPAPQVLKYALFLL